MTTDQLVLALPPDPRQGATRKRDRQTSKDAAKSMSGDVLRNQQRQVLDLVACCQHGVTAYEAHVQLGYQQNVMAKRLGELGELGFVFRREGTVQSARSGRVEVVFETRPGGSGRACDVWRLSDSGAARRVVTVPVGDRL